MSARYSDRAARQFAVACLVWGVIALAAGLASAAWLFAAPADLGPRLSFARLRPLHVHLATHAFLGNLVFAGILYTGQRMLRAPLPSERLAAVHVWGWQLATAAGALALAAGSADVPWAIELALLALWLVFATNVVGMVRRRAERRLYVAIWFYLATLVLVSAVMVARIVAVPVGLFESYPVLGGTASAFQQAWVDRGLESFLITAPLFGLMYFLVPTAAGRPLYSYRLAVMHFWAFVLVAGWIAPERLLFEAVPDWLQAIGLVFGLILWVPAFAGALSGWGTMRGAGTRLLADPVLKLCAAALVCLVLSALEAALLGAGQVSLVTGYTDWMHDRSHLGTMGWAGLMAAATLYWMVPRLFGRTLRSQLAARAHVYLAVVGLLLYVGGTWLAGATQGAMLHSQTAAGGLRYEFVDTLAALNLAYVVRIAGGALYILGFLIMAANLGLTMAGGRAATEEEDEDELPDRPASSDASLGSLFRAPPVIIAALTMGLLVAAGMADLLAALASVFLAVCVAVAGAVAMGLRSPGQPAFHARLEGHALAMTVLIAAAGLSGGIVQLGGLLASSAADDSDPVVYTPLELAGRDVYRREGCASCHTQMVRPLLSEVARYGEVMTEANPHDRPVLWGSRRVGPDLARVGEREPVAQLYEQLFDPRSRAPSSRMPAYDHLAAEHIDEGRLARKLRVLAALGAPYAREDIERAPERARAQGAEIAAIVEREQGAHVDPSSELVALLAYVKRLRGREPPSADEEAER